MSIRRKERRGRKGDEEESEDEERKSNLSSGRHRFSLVNKPFGMQLVGPGHTALLLALIFSHRNVNPQASTNVKTDFRQTPGSSNLACNSP